MEKTASLSDIHRCARCVAVPRAKFFAINDMGSFGLDKDLAFDITGWLHRQALRIACLAVTLGVAPAFAAGTPAGTVISNTASVSFDLDGSAVSLDSNTVTVTVEERIDVVTTLRSPQIVVAPGDTAQAALFTVTNTGNGTETFALSVDSALIGDDFNPDPAVPAIYFDTDASGDFNVGDEAYQPGVNDPALAADASIDVFIVNDIPGTAVNGQRGLSQLTATSQTGTGSPGDVFAGQGDNGVDAVIGTTGGEGSDVAEYLVSDVQISIQKAQLVADPFGGTEPVPGATITYTVTVEVTSTGTATASTLRDPIPELTTFVPDSITLNGNAISDAADTDEGEIDDAGAPTVVVRLGDLTLADGQQTVTFSVTID
jgi:uncharacterized repeat protein (TIGR01451 family)